jgi:dTDP-4-dehydrorhamnose reductase
VRRLEAQPDHELVWSAGHAECDLADPDAIERLFEPGAGEGASVLFNAAAYTAVDRCESEQTLAHRVNAEGPGRLARRCRDAGALLVHVSTDYVFSGVASTPWKEDAPTAPINAYGRSKLLGEVAVTEADPEALIVRTSWVFGPGRNFVGAIVEQAQKRRRGEVAGPLTVVDDQVGSPTYAAHLADGLVALAETALDESEGGEPARGIYHLSGSGATTWFDFAREILDRTGFEDLEIEPRKTSDLDLPAARPAYSVLDTSRAAACGVRLPAWEDGLDAYLASPDGAALMESGAR